MSRAPGLLPKWVNRPGARGAWGPWVRHSLQGQPPLFSPPGHSPTQTRPLIRSLGLQASLGQPQAVISSISGPSGHSQGLGVLSLCRTLLAQRWASWAPRLVWCPPGAQGEWPDLQKTGPQGVAERGGGLWTDWPKPGLRTAGSGHRPLPAGGFVRPGPQPEAGSRPGWALWEWGAAEGRAGACRVLLHGVRPRGRGWG